MADRPIIFSAPMVRALLDGRKTQTRRLLNPQPFVNGFRYDAELGDILCHEDMLPPSALLRRMGKGKNSYVCSDMEDGPEGMSGFYTGDRLYVRENFQLLSFGGYQPTKAQPADVRFAATDPCADLPADTRGYPWRPSIHMPRWASRLTLIVEDVRIERLQAISEADAQAEGVERGVHPITGDLDGWHDYSIIHAGPHKGKKHPHAIAPWKSAALSFQSLWDTLHGVESWNENPFVVALTFRVERANIDQIDQQSQAPRL